MAETQTFLTRSDARDTTLPLELANTFLLGSNDPTSYKHQYANLYFIRLVALRKHALKRAKEQWKAHPGNPTFVPRLLDVSKGKVCWVVGTVYKEMPLKDNVLNDLAREHGIAPPPPRIKFHSEEDQIFLEDETGRIVVVGDLLSGLNLVTGLIVAVLGMEKASGDFEAMDICYPGAAPQDSALNAEVKPMEVDAAEEWIAFVSGLNIGPPSAPSDLRINLLVEYLLGEAGDDVDQRNASRISRLILAGDSFAPINYDDTDAAADAKMMVPGELAPLTTRKASKKYGYEPGNFSAHPTQSLSGHLTELAKSMVIHLVPGASDPSGITLPQQPLPRAMFGDAKNYESFHVETNPCWIGAGTCHMLGNGGQPLDDAFRYVKSSDRLGLACETLKWRHMAPSAPDTLWCYPFFSADPFIMAHTPHIYFIGNQPRFETTIVEQEDGQRTRVILLPKFTETGEVILVNPVTLAVKSVQMNSDWDSVDV